MINVLEFVQDQSVSSKIPENDEGELMIEEAIVELGNDLT